MGAECLRLTTHENASLASSILDPGRSVHLRSAKRFDVSRELSMSDTYVRRRFVRNFVNEIFFEESIIRC